MIASPVLFVPDTSLAPVSISARPPASRAPEEVYLASLAPSGRRSQHARLLGVARMLGADSIDAVPWERMRYANLAAIRSRLLASGLSPNSVNSTLSALKRVAKEARRLGFMTSEEYDLIEDVEGARGSRALAGRRDTAAILLLYGGGLRRGELPELEPSDWDAANRAVRVRQGTRSRVSASGPRRS